MKNIGKPCAGKPHARFDEGGQVRTCSLLYRDDSANLATAARAIIIAVMANTITKSGMAIGLGSSELRRISLPIAALLLATGTLGALLL